MSNGFHQNQQNAGNTAFLQKRSEFESPYRHYKLETALRPVQNSTKSGQNNTATDGTKKGPGAPGSGNKVSLFARSSTVSASFGYNLYNMPIIKGLCMDDYNLLNFKHSKDRPYFFGLGIPSRFNCNHGFHKKSTGPGKTSKTNASDPATSQATDILNVVRGSTMVNSGIAGLNGIGSGVKNHLKEFGVSSSHHNHLKLSKKSEAMKGSNTLSPSQIAMAHKAARNAQNIHTSNN